MKKINIEAFDKNQKQGQYGFTLSDSTIVWQSQFENGYVERVTDSETNNFYSYREYYKSGLLREIGSRFKKGEFQKGVWQYYDEHGKLIKEVNYDSAYKFSWDDIILLLKKEEISWNQLVTIGRDSTIQNGARWYVLWEKQPGGGEMITINGTTGEIISKKYQNLRKEI
ncbi:hypothetical protein ACI6Q2_06190 [Chitinophagaceae bacterium LWZ2-11]